MKTTRKITVALLLVLTMIVGMTTIIVSAAGETTEVHNFTENDKESTFFSITGNTSTSKGSVSYNDLTLTKCLKMESSTLISFTAPADGSLTLVFGGSTSAVGKSVKVDGTKYELGDTQILTMDLTAGDHTIEKGDSINLFYMSYTYAGGSTSEGGEGGEGGEDVHTHSYTSEVTTEATCTTPGVKTYTCSDETCGHTYTEEIAVVAHSYTCGACSVCGAADPNYNPVLINFSNWTAFGENTYADGDTYKHSDLITIIFAAKNKIDTSSKTFDDELKCSLRLNFGGSMSTGEVPTKNALKITADKAYTVKLWYVCGGDGRNFALLDSEGNIISETTTETTKNALYISTELVIPEAGTYYVGPNGGSNYLFQIELVPHEHTLGEATTKAPTCTEEGADIATCSVCGYESKSNVVAALGHDTIVDEAVAPTCTATGLTAGSHCSRCDEKVAQEEVAALGHDYQAVVTEPTCEAAGYTTHTCSRCDDSYTDSETPILDHTYDNDEDAECNECGFIRDVACKHSQTIALEAKAPTCTATGLTAGVQCANPDCNEILTAQEEVAALGHDMIVDEAVAPTCTATGLTAGSHCSRCDEKVAQEEVAALGHTEVEDAAVDATCSKPGLTAGSHCSVCEEVLTAQEEVTVPHLFVRSICAVCGAANADFTEPAEGTIIFESSELDVYTSDADNNRVAHGDYFTIIYKNGSKVEDKAEVVFSDGYRGVRRLAFGGKINVASGGVVNKSAIEITTKGPATVKIWWVCGNSDNERYVAIITSDKTEIDATAKGLTYNPYIDTLEIPAAGTYYIGNLGNANYIYRIEVVETPHTHTPVVDAAVPATCTTPGKTEGSHCSECNEVIVAQTEIPATGHYYVLDICYFCYDIRPSIVLGDNNMTVGEAGSAFGMIKIDEAGNYKITADPATTVCIFTTPIFADGADFSIAADGTLGASWYVFAEEAELQPGYYYVAAYIAGEYTVNVSKVEPTEEPAHKNALVLGDNKIVVTDTLAAAGAEYIPFVVTEKGHYTFSANTTMVAFIFTIEINTEGADFGYNGASWGVYVYNEADLEPGTYWIGLRYVECGAGEFTMNITKSDIVPPHEHNFVNGECECGEKDPNYIPEQPGTDEPGTDEPGTDEPGTDEPEQPEPNFFQRIWAAIVGFFGTVGNFFKGLFVKIGGFFSGLFAKIGGFFKK